MRRAFKARGSSEGQEAEEAATAKCELCGNAIVGPSRYVIVEGSKVITCSDCAKYSTGEWKPSKPGPKAGPRRRALPAQAREEALKEEALRVVPSYPTLIKEARERAGLPIERLAYMVGLKESQVRKIESGKLAPSLREAKLFEHVLKISLVSAEEVVGAPKGPKPQALTIGDVIEFKEGKEEG
ncbi:MAG: TIGR00270 family protein [Candidatus Brockarchaeota archaeon]|nr:TIGR00270 family protein [Candidatus Brockarchaeota archaeon]